MAGQIRLRVPDRALLGAYEAALRDGWSPNTVRDVAPEQIEAIATDPDAFLRGILGLGGRIRIREGLEVEKLPDRVRWIFAADRPGEPFVGAINLRWQEDEKGRPIEALPAHVLGHVGYSVLPRFAGNGYATAALAGMLQEAREVGLPRSSLPATPAISPPVASSRRMAAGCWKASSRRFTGQASACASSSTSWPEACEKAWTGRA